MLLRRGQSGVVPDRPVVFFGGKGGVGKTTLASATAIASAAAGIRTLLVSTDPAHSTSDMLGTELGSDPRPVLDHLDALEIDPALEADRYIAEVKAHIGDVTPPRLVAEVERQIDIARLSPGAEEAALLDRFTRLLDRVGDASYDRLVFDTAPLGHTLRLLALPEQMAAWTAALIGRRRRMSTLSRMWRTVAGTATSEARPDPVLGALEERRTRFDRARAVLTDAGRTAFVLVTTLEELPLRETERAVRALDRSRIPLAAVVFNRVRVDREAAMAAAVERFAHHSTATVPDLGRDVQGIDALRDISLAASSGPTLGADRAGGEH